MEKQKLLDFAAFLDGLRIKEGFSLSSWKCKTAACAIGWGIDRDALPGMRWHGDPSGNLLQPEYDGKFGWDAVEKYFGLTVVQSDIFDDDHYDGDATPKDVAAAIRGLVNQ